MKAHRYEESCQSLRVNLTTHCTLKIRYGISRSIAFRTYVQQSGQWCNLTLQSLMIFLQVDGVRSYIVSVLST